MQNKEEKNIFEYPCMEESEINFIENYLDKEKDMLEFGSGGSTFYFSNKVKNLISIEHDQYWAHQMNQKIKEKDIKNVKILFAQPNMNYMHGDSPWAFRHQEFKNYIQTPEFIRRNIGDFNFDVVLIDGRARVECAKFIYPYLSDDSIIILHDYVGRPRYDAIFQWYEEVECIRTGRSALAVKRKNSERIMSKYFQGFPDEFFKN